MPKGQRHTPEQIIAKLREAEVEIAKSGSVAAACKKVAVTEETSADCTPLQSSASGAVWASLASPMFMCFRIDPRSGRLPRPVITSLPCPPSPIRREPTTPRRAQL